MFRTKRVAACILAFAAIGAGCVPSHNFVDFDLTAKEAKPLPVFNGVSVELLDADSGMRNGDLVSYETLSISQNFQASIDAATHNVSYRTWLVTQTVRFQVSCAWRTIQATGFQTSGDGTNLFFPPPRQIRLLRDSRLSAFVDALCANRPVTAAKGAPSIDAAKAQWRKMFPAPGGFKAITVTGTQRTPATAPWMATGLTHKFAVIEKDGTSGNLLFFD